MSASPSERSPHALTVDVQEYFQARAFRDLLVPDEWDTLPSRVDRSVGRLLSLLSDHRAAATFFFDPWVASRHPDLVATVAGEGHEIGVLTPLGVVDGSGERLDRHLSRVLPPLRELSADAVIGHRTQWTRSVPEVEGEAGILLDHGLEYDSGVCPTEGSGGDDPSGRLGSFRVGDGERRLGVLPLSVFEMSGLAVPVARRHYLRIAPYRVTRRALESYASRGETGIVRVRAWELDPHQPRLSAGAASRFRHYVGLDRTRSLLDRLLTDFDLGPAGAATDAGDDAGEDDAGDRGTDDEVAKRAG